MFRIYPVSVNGNLVSGIQDVRTPRGVDVQRALSDGGIDARFAAVTGRGPRGGFDTIDLLTALGIIGIDGVVGDVVMYDKSVDAVGGAAAGSAHNKYTFSMCLTVLRRISARARGLASANYECTGYGSSYPLTTQKLQALGTDATGSIATYTVGPVVLNGTRLDKIVSIDLDTGITLEVDPSEVDTWPSAVSIGGKVPLITVATSDPAAATAIGEAGLAVSTVTAYLRKRAMTSTHYATGSNHISLTQTAGVVIPLDTAGGGRLFTFAILPVRTAGGGAPGTVVVSLAATLPS